METPTDLDPSGMTRAPLDEIQTANLVRTCIIKNLDHENLAKFRRVLQYVGPGIYEPLYLDYNSKLMIQIRNHHHASNFPEGYTLDQYVQIKIKFYSFRFISDIGNIVLERINAGDDQAQKNFASLTKILFYHGLTSKSDTANLALVEFEQLCVSRQITFNDLYQQNRAKYLRVIIKALLHKLVTSNGNINDSSTGNESSSQNDSTWSVNRSNQSNKINRVITYMTRALELFNVVTITSEDVAKSLVIITNLIHKDKYNPAIGFFLNCLASYQNLDICTLIETHIQAIVVSLLLKQKLSHDDISSLLTKLCLFCKKTPHQILANKFVFIKGRLLLHYSIDPKFVKNSIFFLSKFEKEEHEQPFEDEFEEETNLIDYLYPSMIGILLGVDSHFNSTKNDLGSEVSIKHIESLTRLLSIMSDYQVQAIHVKLLSTLSLLIRLRPKRDNQILNKALKDLWSAFVAKLGIDLRLSLFINICVALYDLVEDCPKEVAEIYTDLICKRHPSEQLVEKLKLLFFIPNLPHMSEIYSYLTPYVRRENSVANLQEFQQSLDCVLPLLKFENQKCLLIAVTKIKQLLQSNEHLLISNMLMSLDEPLDNVISKTIESLIALSSTPDAECSALIAECLGLLGAVNPIRLDHLIYGEISGKTPINVTNLTDPAFVVDLIERLKSSLFSDQRSESETATYAIQVVVETYDVFKDTKINQKLTQEALRACHLCQNTSYIASKKAQPDTSISVYEKFKSDNRYCYRDWIDKFSLNLISAIKDKKIHEVLYACLYVFRYNLKLAEYLLPSAIVYIIINQPLHATLIRNEIMSVIEEDVGVSTQDVNTIYTDDTRGSIQTLHFQCANMIFGVLDTIHRLYNDTKDTKPSVALSAKQVEHLREFIDCIPKDKLAILATKCRSHARALCYLDQYLSGNKNQIDKYATVLQRIYVALDDTFEAAGVEMIRTSPTSIIDDIANFEACGRFDKAFICCDTLLASMEDKIDREPLIEDALRCLSNQGDYQRLYEKSKQLICEYSQSKRSILPYAIEAHWKLGKWEEMCNTFKNEPIDNITELTTVNQGFLIMSLVDNENRVPEKLKIVRQRLMKPLSIAMKDRSAYFRGYQNLLALHSIGDFAYSSDILNNYYGVQPMDENTIDIMRSSLNEKLDLLFDKWNTRNKLVQPSLSSLEPLLVWQRSISLVLSKKYPFLKDRINVDVGRMWLTSADSAREARSFERSFFCLIQAQRWFGSEFDKLKLDLKVRYYTEQAKLNWEQNEQTKAIRGLKLSLERLKDHDIYRHLMERSVKYRHTDPFPQLNNLQPCADCRAFDQSELESFAKLKMLLTHYCEEAAACLPETLFFMYEECVHLGVNQEETYFRLARYYDKLLTYYMDNPSLCCEQQEDHNLKNQFEVTQRFSQNLVSGDKEEVYTKLMEHSVIAFGNSLKYGIRYLRESMPRLLNIWYDLGSKKPRPPQGCPRSISSRIENTVRFIDELKTKYLPPYYFMTAMSLLLSRVCHPHSGASKKTCEILELLLANYPHQITWQLIALLNETENEDRKKAAKIIISNTKKKHPEIWKIADDTVRFSKVLIDIARNAIGDKDDTTKKKLAGMADLKEVAPSAVRLDFTRSRVIVPIQASIRAILPMDNACDNLESHNIFPASNVSYVKAFVPKVRIYHSLMQPRMASLICDNGRTVNILCKSGDDLRKDSRCIEFLNLLNMVLRRDSLSNARFFEIKTFLVLPLESSAGIIEMVPNCDSMRNILEPIYKENKIAITKHDSNLKKLNEGTHNLSEITTFFKDTVLPTFQPPVLPTWFLRNFNEPTSWYMARLAFTRSAAVCSMGGYIIGLGDRHLDNILVDMRTGGVIHVDFNLLFHQAETLPVPEKVPFRLTHNIVAAFGPMGTEGNFRKVCEITMRVMRKEKDALLTTLKPFMHDPCSEWVKVREPRDRVNHRADQEDRHTGNKSAKYRIEVTERKLKGFPRSKKFKPLALIDSYSVEAQVDNLIEEALDICNIATMYFGWAPQI